MTYCLGIVTDDGLVMASDSRSNAGFDQVNVSVGARNLFNTYPDQMRNPNNNNGNTLPWAAASPFGYNGRYLYTRAAITLAP